MSSTIPSLLQYWKSFELSKFQKELDECAADIATRQDESETSRKKLVEQSKEFKVNTPEDVRKVVAPLLKSFQGEIDNLSKRSKAAEASFLSAYKKILDLPDSIPALESLSQLHKKAQRAADLEVEVKNLRETLEQYNAEFAEVKNQEVTIRQLREKVKVYEDEFDSAMTVKIQQKEVELKQVYEEREKQIEEAGNVLSAKLQESERRFLALQSVMTEAQTELYDLKNQNEEHSAVKSTEVEMLISEAERANHRAISAERELEQAKEELKQLKETSAATIPYDTGVGRIASLETEISAKDKQINHLLQEIQKLQSNIKSFEQTKADLIEELQTKLNGANELIKQLEERLHLQTDYEELKRELLVIKSIEFGDKQNSNLTAESKPLEALLLEKNKSLQSENTALKLANKKVEEERNRTHYALPAEASDNCSQSPRSCSPLSVADSFEPLATTMEDSNAPMIAYNDLVLGQLSADSFANGDLQSQFQRILSNIPELQDSSLVGCVGTSNSYDDDLLKKNTSSSEGPAEEIMECSWVKQLEEASKSKVPREIIEAMAVQNMQNIIQRRVEKLSLNTLDTVSIAQRCKHLLNVYNIGQRLFSKAVLNQSQGALSELLAKPKTWERLTEKGRDSFRKIQAWLLDKDAIDILRYLCPKRFSPSCRSNGLIVVQQQPEEVASSFVRINDILSQVKSEVVEATNECSADTDSVSNTSLSNFLQDQLQNGTLQQPQSHQKSRSYRYRHDDIPKEKIFEIFERESAKLKNMEQAFKQDVSAKEFSKRSHSGMSASSADGSMSDNNDSGFGSRKRRNNNNNLHLEKKQHMFANRTSEICDDSSEDGGAPLNRKVNCAIKLEDVEINFGCSVPSSMEQDPLAQIQSITNSLAVSKNPTFALASTSTGSSLLSGAGGRSLKTVLPPITQDQFDKYSSLNTEDVVSQIKEYLNQHSISQRLFGEAVLGLSQGSVSDLLARPKAWNMLTQKGKEPFVRMMLFLSDPEASQRLLEAKNMGAQSGGLLTALFGGSLHSDLPSSQCSNDQQFSQQDLDNFNNCSASINDFLKQLSFSDQFENQSRLSTDDGDEFPEVPVVLDTAEIAELVKTELVQHNIGQKTFGEAVLGLSQGSVSELLSKPKPWGQLSLKGREPFVRMYCWLNDSRRFELLEEFKLQKNLKTKSLLENAQKALSLQEQLDEKVRLINTLERDLLLVAPASQLAVSETPQDPASVSEFPEVLQFSSATNDAAAGNLLPILASQRERFRKRVVELEHDVVQYQQQLGMFQSEIEKIRADNVNLYGKIKFLQSCSTANQKGARSDDTEARYLNQYEEALNPFSRFSQEERTRRYVSLKPHDKATLGIVLYKLAYSESSRRDAAADCALKYQEHMQVVHGAKFHSGNSGVSHVHN